jgi:eukaryotic-like serine/threonine-protein kinase
MVPEVGQRFGPYEILGKLGSGGMGLVFRAWDERLHREVAIKVLHDDYTMPGMRERFLQEARAASALNHPNLCMVFDIGEQDRNPYLVMELLAGETLKERIARSALSVEEIVHYSLEITDALAVAHARGIVHRDIKPANIFLVPMPNGKSQAKVLDFGLAKIALEKRGGWESRTLDMSIAGSTVGTLAYMSPEQARGESLDMRTDLFSLGVVMYEMATRQAPFKGTTSGMMMAELLRSTPERVTTWNDSIPRDLEKVILKLLAKDRKGRFQTAKELHNAIEKIDDKLGRRGWLNKVTIPTVPLVRTSDPAARHKTPKRGTDSRSRLVLYEEAPSHTASIVTRPVHVPDRGNGGAARFSREAMRESAVAVASGPGAGGLHSVRGDAYGATAEADAGSIAPATSSKALPSYTKETWEAARARTKTRAPSAAFLSNRAALESARHEESLQELIAASSTVGARVRVRMVIAAAMIVTGVVLAALVHNGLFRPLVLGANDHLLLTVIQNKTGDKTLDGTVMQGLELALRQSRSLNLLGDEAYLAGQRQIAAESGDTAPASEQEVAQKVGARAYLYGEVKGAGPSLTISVEVLKSDSNDRLATFEETVHGREEIPAAIGRIAHDIRAEFSEDNKDALQNSTRFETDVTADIRALHAFAEGEAAAHSGRTNEAMAAFQRAVGIDPKFVQAQMELGWLYRAEKAEVSAANAAALARDASGSASDKVKLLARFCYEMNVSADYAHAVETIRDYAARYPLDADGMKGLARALNAQELLEEALAAAKQGYGQHPLDAGMYAEAQIAMIGMNRYENALQLKAQAERVGLMLEDNTLATGYLAGREDIVAAQSSAIESAEPGFAQTSFGSLYDYGNYLDNTGRTAAGAALWKAAAARAASIPGLASTAAAMLAQGALNRALTENCTVALEMVNEGKDLSAGPLATFHAGMAAALCGDQPYAEKVAAELQQEYPQSNVVTQSYVPLLQAAAEIGVNEPAKTIQLLTTLSQADPMPITPYLRGMAEAALGDLSTATLDFQEVQTHRGAALLWGGAVYPIAEMQTARVYAEERDKSNSVASYQRFLALWGGASYEQPLLAEALAKSSQP